jgi:NAD(P)H-dependent FMN reductase
MIVVGSVRPGRIGLPIAEWVRDAAEAHGGFEVDFADLAEINLPFMDEPNQPMKRAYTKPHTIAWSTRVDAADAFVFVTPEYNHSSSPVLVNAINYLAHEWSRKAVGLVSYGGISAGTRSVIALEPVLTAVGLMKTGATLEIPLRTSLVDGVFTPAETASTILGKVFAELELLTTTLAPLRG